MNTKVLRFEALSRVEGEGSLTLCYRNGALEQARLRIFEPPRYFEAFLVGRRYDEAPDITARICGICPIAYQLSSSTAMESALGVKVEGQLRELRRLVYCGEWIESHALHVHLLHAPDFFGCDDAIALAQLDPEAVKRGLRLKKLGNEIIEVVGGRSVHPVNLKVGGFYRAPTVAELRKLKAPLEAALDDAIAATTWVSKLDFPNFEPATEYVAMRHGSEYPLFEGRLVSTTGLDIPIDEFDKHFRETQVSHSHALQCSLEGVGAYQVGPLARYNLNADLLTPEAKRVANEVGLPDRVRNPFMSIVVRMVEVVFAIEEALRVVNSYAEPEAPYVAMFGGAGEGCGCSEAPRGFCWHRYTLGEHGVIARANIVPPTSQNQARIEQDIMEWAPRHESLPEEEFRKACEHAIRNYDPCISCATHSLKLTREYV